jgi:hypothetical protein
VDAQEEDRVVKAAILALFLVAQVVNIAPYSAPSGWTSAPSTEAPRKIPENVEQIRLWSHGTEQLMWLLEKKSLPLSMKAMEYSLQHVANITDLRVEPAAGCTGSAIWVHFRTSVPGGLVAFESTRLVMDNNGRRSEIWYGYLAGNRPDHDVLTSMQRYCRTFDN